MKKILVFSDPECSVEIERVLYEGRTYYVLFPTENAELIHTALTQAGLNDFVLWHRFNRVATLRVVNRIGLVSLFGRLLDIRSEKLLEGETGDRQFQIILDDLALLSRHILFARTAAPAAHRAHDVNVHQPSLLERFNFYRQTCLQAKKCIGLEKLIARVLRNPHNRLVDEHAWDKVWNLKRPSKQSMLSLFHPRQEFMLLPDGHPYSTDRRGLRDAASGEHYFPLKALRARRNITIDTAENRFVKHVLLDIAGVCSGVVQQGLVWGSLLKQAESLLRLSRQLLSIDFFKDVGPLQAIPHSSPTLVGRHGYRELYQIYVRSLTGAKHLFEDIAEESLFIELKDIALLYEYWVFYKVASALLGPNAFLLSRDAVVKDGRIVNAAVVTDGVITISFNKTFGRKPNGSYSLSLRPDVVVEAVSPNRVRPMMYVLDAKYKSSAQPADEDAESLLRATRGVKSEDIHKMHCYADSIEGVCSAVVIYPGTKFVFYPRDRTTAPMTNAVYSIASEGVGAVPLLPGQDSSLFDNFMVQLKESSSSLRLHE